MPISFISRGFKYATAPSFLVVFFLLFDPMHRQSKQWPKVPQADKLSVALLLFCLEGEAGYCHCHWGVEWFGGTTAGEKGGKPCPRTCCCILSDVPEQQQKRQSLFSRAASGSPQLSLFQNTKFEWPLHRWCGFSMRQNSPYTNVFSENSPLQKQVLCPKLRFTKSIHLRLVME